MLELLCMSSGVSLLEFHSFGISYVGTNSDFSLLKKKNLSRSYCNVSARCELIPGLGLPCPADSMPPQFLGLPASSNCSFSSYCSAVTHTCQPLWDENSTQVWIVRLNIDSAILLTKTESY